METEEKTENAGNVRVLTPAERLLFDGITIEGGVDPDARNRKAGDDDKLNFIKKFFINRLTVKSDSLLTKIVLALVITGAVFFLLFVALPIALVVLGVLLIVWLLMSFFQKR